MPGAFKLDHLQQIKPILFHKIYNFFTFILGVNSYYPREGKAENGKLEFSQPECERGILVPGAFKLDHLQPVKPILFPRFSNFFTFILGANSYYPREWQTENGEMEITQSLFESGISVPGAFKLDHLQPVEPILFPRFSNFFTFILGVNSYYPREWETENGKMEFSQPECERGISVPGAFKLDNLQPVEPLLF